MKKLIIFIFIISSSGLFSQEAINSMLEIKYDIHYNTEIPNTKKGTLFIDKSLNKSLFVYGKNKDKKVDQNDDENVIRVRFRESKRFNYINFTTDTTYSKEKVFNDEFIIAEKKADLEWKLIDETKKIDSISVKKAILSFRGRNYVAWYSDKYPLRFGPWKFQNLPGLIIEIYDETKRYHWVVTSISKNNDTKIINFSEMKDEIKKISLKEFVDKRYNKSIGLLNESRLPRGTISNKRKIKRNGIEIKFEWEEDKKED